MERDGGVRIVAQVELVKPTEFEACLAYGIVTVDGMRMMLGDISRMAGDLVCDHTLLHIVLVRQSKMFLRRHITQHCSAIAGDFHTADRRRDVVVAGSGVSGERSKRIERRILADRLLHFDVHAHGVERNMARSFDHHLHVVFPCALGKLAQSHQFGKLCRIVRIGKRSRTKSITQ